MTLSIQPMQWSVLPDLHEAAPLDDNDLECLEELRDWPGTASCDASPSISPIGILFSVPAKS